MSAIAAAITAAEIAEFTAAAIAAADAAAAATAAESVAAANAMAGSISTAAGSGGMMPSAAALTEGAATGEALGVSGGTTGSGLSSLSASGLETGNALSRGLTQVGKVLNNPYVQGGIGVAQGGKTYAETGDLGQSFMAGLGAWGMAGAAGGLSSFAGRELGGAALSQGAKQGVKSAIPQIAPKTLYDSSVLGGSDVLNAERAIQPYTPNVGRGITDTAAQRFAGNMYSEVPQVSTTQGAVNNKLYLQPSPATPQLPPRVAPTPGLPTGTTQVAPTPTEKPGWFDDFPKNYPGGGMGALATGAVGGPMLMNAMQPSSNLQQPETKVTPYRGPYKPTERIAQFPTGPASYTDTSEFQYFNDVNPYPGVTEYPGTVKAAVGGLMGLTAGGSFDDEAGQDGDESTNYSYADGGEVEKNMSTPDMKAIQEYVQSINQPQQGDSNALQSYLNNIGRQQQRPQVPEILRQLQAQHATQTQTPVDSSEHNYGFKPVTVEKAPPVQYAPAPASKSVNPLLALFGGMGNSKKQAAPVPVVDKYAPYRPITMTTPGEDPHEYQYTDTSKYVYNPETQQMEIPLAVGGLTSLARGGNYLDGPGDGLSDSIRATIGNRQPARLADGEFVISADVVSDIGGGSSKAGAKKLHAMMDRVRQSAHGTKKQVKKINDRKVLAA